MLGRGFRLSDDKIEQDITWSNMMTSSSGHVFVREPEKKADNRHFKESQAGSAAVLSNSSQSSQIVSLYNLFFHKSIL